MEIPLVATTVFIRSGQEQNENNTVAEQVQWPYIIFRALLEKVQH